MRAKHSPLLIVTLLASCVAASAQAVRSVYTTLRGDKCKTLKEEGSYTLLECPGVAGYKLRVDAVDLTEGLTVVKADGSEHEINVGQVGGGYPSVGPTAEWRVRTEKGKLVPIALIVRVNVDTSADSGRGRKGVGYLTVSKITPEKICMTQSIRADRNANVKARRLADDSAGKPCYELRGPDGPQ
jgi:hypothetical protein